MTPGHLHVLGRLGPRWANRAACADNPTDLWTVDQPSNATIAAAKAICRRCPAVDECLAAAEQEGDAIGIRGGLTHAERRDRGAA